MRYISRALLPGALGFAVAVLVAACGGGSGLLSAGQATNLDNQLNTIAARINNGQCSAATSAAHDFDNSVANLTGIAPALQNNLKQASSALASQAGSDCQNQQTTSVPKTTTTPTKTVTTPKNTTPTNTTPTSSTPTSTSPATTTGSGTTTAPATTTSGSGTNPSGGAGLTGTGSNTGTVGTGGAPTQNGQ